MNRILVLSVAALVMLFAQVSAALAAGPTIQVDGQLAGGNSVSGKPEIPPNQAASQAKTMFSLMGGSAPIFQPFSGRVAVAT